MRPNRREPASAPFWFQSLSLIYRPHGAYTWVARMAASYNQAVANWRSK